MANKTLIVTLTDDTFLPTSGSGLDTGAKAPTVAVTAAEDPWLDNDWVNPNNIFGAGEAEVSSAAFDAGDQTYVLKAKGFPLFAIPPGSTIVGVQVVINARYATAPVSIDLVQLLDTSGAKVGTNLAATPQALTTSAANYTFGGSSNLWGNSLTAAWVTDPDFGVAIGCLAGGSGNSNNDVYIDSVTMQVWYTSPLTFDAARREAIDAIVSAQGETHGWNVEKANIPVTALARTSSTVATLTIPSLPNYNITAQEVLTWTIPPSILTGEAPIVATPTVTIAATADTVNKSLADSGSGADAETILADIFL